MRLLIDSHTVIWSGDDPEKIPEIAMASMSDPSNDRLVSVATVWEIAIKFGNGKLPLSMPFRPWMDQAIAGRRAPVESGHRDNSINGANPPRETQPRA